MSTSVLIADDSAVVRAALARRLRAAGHVVVEQDCARTAKTVDTIGIACALLDFDLGDGDGAEVAEHLRRISPDLPIAFFTSTSTPEAQARARLFGPVFVKPDDLEEAVQWVGARVGERSKNRVDV